MELQRGDKEAINSVIGVLWRLTDGRCPIPIPPLPLAGARIQRERITKQDIDELGASVGCPGCTAIKDNKGAQTHSDRCRARIEECLRVTPEGAERLDRRSEVIDEALAEEQQRDEQRKERGTTAAPAPTSAASTSHESREGEGEGEGETPVEPDPNPKRRLLTKSAS